MLSFKDRLFRETTDDFDNRGFTFKKEGEDSLLSSIIKSAREEANRRSQNELDTYSPMPKNSFSSYMDDRFGRDRVLEYRSQSRKEAVDKKEEERNGGGGWLNKGLGFAKDAGSGALDTINALGDVVTGEFISPLGELKKREDGTFDRSYSFDSITEGIGRRLKDTVTLGHAGAQKAHIDKEAEIYGYKKTSNPLTALNQIRTEGQQFYEDTDIPMAVKAPVGILTDPLTYVGIGAAGKVAKGLEKLGPAGKVASLPLRGKYNPIGALAEGPGTGRKVAGLAAGASAGAAAADSIGIYGVPDEFEGLVGSMIGGVGGAGAFSIRRPQPTRTGRVPEGVLEIADESGELTAQVAYARRLSPAMDGQPDINAATLDEELRRLIARNMAGEIPSGKAQMINEIENNFGTHYKERRDEILYELDGIKESIEDGINPRSYYEKDIRNLKWKLKQIDTGLEAQRRLAKEIIEVIPEEYINGVRLDFVEGYSFSTSLENMSLGAAGVYKQGYDRAGRAIDPTIARGAVIIAEEAVTRPWNAANVIAHELSHHLETLIPEKEWDTLVRQYTAENAVLSKHYVTGDVVGSNPAWYQTTGGFGEWFAERLGEQITRKAVDNFLLKEVGKGKLSIESEGIISLYSKMFDKIDAYRKSTGFIDAETMDMPNLGVPNYVYDALNFNALSDVLPKFENRRMPLVQQRRNYTQAGTRKMSGEMAQTLEDFKSFFDNVKGTVTDRLISPENYKGYTDWQHVDGKSKVTREITQFENLIEAGEKNFVNAVEEAHPFSFQAVLREAFHNGEDFSDYKRMYHIDTTYGEPELYLDKITQRLRMYDKMTMDSFKKEGISDALFSIVDGPAPQLSMRPYEIDGAVNREIIPELEGYAESAIGPLDKVDAQRHAIQMSQEPPDEPPILKQYAEEGGDLPRKPSANKFYTSLGDSNTFEADAARVRDYKVPFIKKLLSVFINPSAAMTSAAGRGIVAHQVWKVKAKSAVGATLSSSIDVFDERFTGRQQTGLVGSIFRTNIDGTLRGISVPSTTVKGKQVPMHWADLFEKFRADPAGTRRRYNLGNEQAQLINNFWTVLEEANAALKARGINTFESIEKIPRSIKQIDDIKVNWKTNHLMERVFDLASDGVANGVVYNDYRKTLGLYLAAAYEEIGDFELGQYLMKHGVTSVDLSKKSFDDFKEASLKRSQASERVIQAHKALQLDPNNEILKKEWDDAVKGVQKAKLLAKAAENSYRQEVRELTNPEVGKVLLDGKLFGKHEGRVSTNAWRNKYMSQPRPGFPAEKMAVQTYWTKDDFDTIVKYMGAGGAQPDANKVGPIARTIQTLGGGVRFLSASTDFAGWAVHGVPVLAFNPASWARMAVAQFGAFADTSYAPRYIRDHKASIDKMIKAGVPIDTELFEAVEEGSVFRKLTGPLEAKKAIGPAVAEPGKTLGRQTYGRFQSSFATSLLVARTSMWEAFEPMYKGKEDQLAQLIRNATGGLDSGALGVTRGQAAYEAAWMAFSPRLLRSTFGLTAMALDPTLQNRAAWHARAGLMTMAAGAAGLYYGIGEAMGKDHEELMVGLDPRNGKRFLSYNINGDWIGIGGQFRAITQFATNSGAAAINGDWSKFSQASYYENPILNFWTSRGSVGLNMVGAPLEAWTGADFLPYKDIESAPDTFKHLGKSILPFSLQGIMEGDSLKGTTASMFGARVSPETPGEIRTRQLGEMFPEKLAEAERGLTGKPEVTWDDLNKEERRLYNEKYPYDGDVEINNISRYYDGFGQIEDTFNDKVARAQAVVSLGLPGRDKAWFREEYKKAQIEKYAAIDHHREIFSKMPAERYNFDGSVVDYLSSRNTQPEDQAVEAWYDIPKRSIGADGLLDFDMLEKNREEFLASLPENVRDYVARTVMSPEAVSPAGLVGEYERVKEKTLAYFEAPETMFEIVRDASPFFGSFRSHEEIRDYITKLSEESGVGESTITSLLEKKIPEFKKFNDAVSQYRKFIRLADPELDIFLKEWYRYETANPLLPAAKASGSDWEDLGRRTAPAFIGDKTPITRAQAGRLGLQLAAQRGEDLNPPPDGRETSPEMLRYQTNRLTSNLRFRN